MKATNWRNPKTMLMLIAFIMPLVFSAWMVLINNFSKEEVDFTGREIGILQSLREIPGFLAFTAVYVLLFIREQRFAIISLALLSIGVFMTGYFPTVLGLYITTVIMSIGFHYFETINQSLILQWTDKDETAQFMGKLLSIRAAASIIVFASIWLLLDYFGVSYKLTYSLFGIAGIIGALCLYICFPQFESKTEQHKHLLLRKSYWLYYALMFLGGARRQIFTVFAGFLLVEKFGYSAGSIALLFLVNYVLNFFFAEKVGRLISFIGERRALTIEYVGLVIVFLLYAVVENGKLAAVLYVVDHFFFALAIAIKTYLQKIAMEEDIASTMSVSFTINHIAAVMIPAALGLVWLYNHSLVFYFGAGLALVSLVLSQFIPDQPELGNETRVVSSFALKHVGNRVEIDR